jgi:hypothetical protein
MAANTHMSVAAWALALDAALAPLNGGGYIIIYDNTSPGQPATPNVAVTTQVALVTLPLSSTAFAPCNTSTGVKTANAITSATNSAGGTPAWFRAYTSGGVPVIDGSAGLAAAAADMTVASSPFVIGATTVDPGWTVSMPVAQ